MVAGKCAQFFKLSGADRQLWARRAYPFKLSNADRQLWARRAYPFKLSNASTWSDALIFLKLSGADSEAGAHIESSMRDRPAPIRRGPVLAGARAPGAAAQTEVSSDW